MFAIVVPHRSFCVRQSKIKRFLPNHAMVSIGKHSTTPREDVEQGILRARSETSPRNFSFEVQEISHQSTASTLVDNDTKIKQPALHSPWTKWIAYVSLVAVESGIGLLGKIAQTDGHKFAFSPVSAICIAEFLKLCLSGMFLVVETNGISNAIHKVRSELYSGVVWNIASLALLYCFNNQLYFYFMTFIDPGTVFLSKAGATLIVASLQHHMLNRFFSDFQWKAMVVQVLGVVMVQFDPIEVSFEYSVFTYAGLAFSVLVTALSTVQNEHLLKAYNVGLNVQNCTLYFFGILFNLVAYQIPNPYSTSHSFFDGYDRFSAVATVGCNALIGLAISAVYKYADAVTKTMATDATSVILVVASVIFFDFSGRIFVWIGTAVTLTAIHLNQEDARKRQAKQFDSKQMQPKGSIEFANLIRGPASGDGSKHSGGDRDPFV